MHIKDAVATWLMTEYKKPGISFSELFLQVYFLFNTKNFHGVKLVGVHGNSKIENVMANVVEHLFKIKIFIRLMGLSEKSSYFITQKYLENCSDEELVCSIYNYGYISHLSALHLHGMTDRFPKIINYVVFKRAKWRDHYFETNEKINFLGKKYWLPVYPASGELPDKKLNVSVREDIDHFTTKNDGLIRVQPIEPLLIESLKNPSLCGGVNHVIDIFEEYGSGLASSLITYTEKYGSLIDKARIGFMLERVCNVSSNRFDSWKERSIRGGSRVFFTNEPYSSWYDPEWSISLNHERIESYGVINHTDAELDW